MLCIHRGTGESFRIYNELTDKECIITLISHNYPTCVLRINGETQIKKIPEQVEIDINECNVNIMNIDRGVKFGLVAPRHIRLNRI